MDERPRHRLADRQNDRLADVDLDIDRNPYALPPTAPAAVVWLAAFAAVAMLGALVWICAYAGVHWTGWLR